MKIKCNYEVDDVFIDDILFDFEYHHKIKLTKTNVKKFIKDSFFYFGLSFKNDTQIDRISVDNTFIKKYKPKSTTTNKNLIEITD